MGLLDFCFSANLNFENKSTDYGDGFIVTFKDRDAHLAYERHPHHVSHRCCFLIKYDYYL